MRLGAFDTTFDLAGPCASCAPVKDVKVNPATTREHGQIEGVVQLSTPAPRTGAGAIVFLFASDPRLASVPASVAVPPGETSARFL